MGDTSQGTVLRGQVQGVKRGVGVIIFPNGSISFDPTTATGVVKTNNPSAYNNYIWPDANGTANQVLTTSDDGTLSWGNVADDFFKNVFTAKGQLIVGTGVKSYTLQNVGINTAFLVADSATASGLIYTNNSSSSVLLPVGTSAQRDCYCDPLETALTGQFRYSTTYTTLEFYNGVKWVQVAASDLNIETFVKQTVPLTGTASAVIIGGTSAQRQNAPLAGYFRYNTDEKVPEFYDGTVWNTFIHSILPGTTGLTFTGVPTPEAGIVQVGGTLVLANGGTGATTQPGAANNILPPQSANSKKFLTTDGTNVSWTTVDGNGALTAGAGIGIAGGPSNTTVVSNTGIITNTAGSGIGVSTAGGNSTISNTGIITNTAGPGIGVSTTGTNSTITNTGVRSLVAGYGIDIDNPTGVSTISLEPGLIKNYPPIFLVPLTGGVNVIWGSPTGLGPTSGSTDLFEVNYPAGPNYALLQTRVRCDLIAIAGADYSAAAGFGFVDQVYVQIQITGDALPNTNLGLFAIDPSGFIAGYSSGTFYNSAGFMIRTNQVSLTNPAGGKFYIQLVFSQIASGPNTVRFNSPQFVISPFSMT
jgi:hypothetical protein